MDLGQLRAFYQVAKLKSFAGAAEALFVTPPAISIKIKQLEEHYELKLFERSSRRVELTDSGEVLLGYAERVFNLVKEADRHMDDLKGGLSGNLKISTGLTVGTYYLAPLINTFSKQFPGLDIQMKVKNKQGVIDDILHLSDDLGFVGNVPINSKLVVTPLWREELVVITSKTHSFGKKQSILPAELSDQPLIVREKGSGTREYIEDRLRRQGVAIKTVMEIGSDEAIKRAVAVGLGISIVPIGVTAKEVKRGLIRQYRIEKDRFYLDYFMIYHKDKYISNLLKNFMDATPSNTSGYSRHGDCSRWCSRLIAEESNHMTMRLLFVGNSHTYLKLTCPDAEEADRIFRILLRDRDRTDGRRFGEPGVALEPCSDQRSHQRTRMGFQEPCFKIPAVAPSKTAFHSSATHACSMLRFGLGVQGLFCI